MHSFIRIHSQRALYSLVTLAQAQLGQLLQFNHQKSAAHIASTCNALPLIHKSPSPRLTCTLPCQGVFLISVSLASHFVETDG